MSVLRSEAVVVAGGSWPSLKPISCFFVVRVCVVVGGKLFTHVCHYSMMYKISQIQVITKFGYVMIY